MINLERPLCPECGEVAGGTVEVVHGKALLQRNNNGLFEYAGGTDIFWDEQKTVLDANGQVTLICHQGHDWQSLMVEVDDAQTI